MSHLPALVADNLLLLDECADVLDGLPPEAYAAGDDRCLGSSIGGHVRHCLEHYGSFFDGLDVGRQLAFLLSHTIHHCALIAVMMRLRGLATPPGFGLAPATLRHREAQQIAAASDALAS